MRSSCQVFLGTVTTLRTAAALSLLVAAIHLWVMPEHFEVWWGYGAFFLALAVAQGLYALGLLLRPTRSVLLLGVAGNLTVAILWLVTRTTGVPLLGPHAREVEGVGVLDLACTLGEVWIVTGLGTLAMRDLPTEGRIQIVVVLAPAAPAGRVLIALIGKSIFWPTRVATVLLIHPSAWKRNSAKFRFDGVLRSSHVRSSQRVLRR